MDHLIHFYDAAFDNHLISFDDDGGLILADDFNATSAKAVGIDPDAKLPTPSPQMRLYLSAHRDQFAARRERLKKIGGQKLKLLVAAE